jgi:hypothetical protein
MIWKNITQETVLLVKSSTLLSGIEICLNVVLILENAYLNLHTRLSFFFSLLKNIFPSSSNPRKDSDEKLLKNIRPFIDTLEQQKLVEKKYFRFQTMKNCKSAKNRKITNFLLLSLSSSRGQIEKNWKEEED